MRRRTDEAGAARPSPDAAGWESTSGAGARGADGGGGEGSPKVSRRPLHPPPTCSPPLGAQQGTALRTGRRGGRPDPQSRPRWADSRRPTRRWAGKATRRAGPSSEPTWRGRPGQAADGAAARAWTTRTRMTCRRHRGDWTSACWPTRRTRQWGTWAGEAPISRCSHRRASNDLRMRRRRTRRRPK